MNPDLHKKVLQNKIIVLILNNFRWLQKQHKAIIIRIPLIENITDTAENFEAIRELLGNSKNIQRI